MVFIVATPFQTGKWVDQGLILDKNSILENKYQIKYECGIELDFLQFGVKKLAKSEQKIDS